jgi:hypothetical protein
MSEVERVKQRLLGKRAIDAATGCWLWTGAVKTQKRPYGSIVIGSRRDGTRQTARVHRLSYELWNGPIADGLHVCHACDNHRCFNPEHLFLGTPKDNADDRDRKGRLSPAPYWTGETHPSAKLKSQQVAEIRASNLSSYKLSPQYGVSPGQIRAVKRGRYFPAPPKELG